MKVLIVTSDISYVPKNQLPLFEKIFAESETHIAGLIVLRNVSMGLMLRTAWLRIMGCKNIANCLAVNILNLPFKKREALWKRRGLPVLKTNSMNDASVINWVKDHKIDLIINVRTRCIYKKEILNATRFGCINVHHGILPKYRGTLCDLYALADSRPAGFTIHVMNEKLDDGDILVTREVSVGKEKDYMRYLAKTGVIEAEEISNIINYASINHSLPNGRQNIVSNAVYTKTPKSRLDIKALKSKGMVL